MTPSTVDRVRIKVCGITTPEEAKACVDLGADMIGINCWEPSPRYVSKEKLSAITDLIGDHVETVALFVNEDPEKVNSLMEETGFNTAQLHGDESPPAERRVPQLLQRERQLDPDRPFRRVALQPHQVPQLWLLGLRL